MSTYDERLEAVVARAKQQDHLHVLRELSCPRGCKRVLARVVAVDEEMLLVAGTYDGPRTNAAVRLARAARLSGGRARRKIPPRGHRSYVLLSDDEAPRPVTAWCPKHGTCAML